MTKEKAEKVRTLLNQRDDCSQFLNIKGNYDSKLKAVVSSFHNNNRKVFIEKEIALPISIQEEIIEYVNQKIEELDKEISEL